MISMYLCVTWWMQGRWPGRLQVVQVTYSTVHYSIVQNSTAQYRIEVQVTSVAETQQVSSQWLVSRQRGHQPPG